MSKLSFDQLTDLFLLLSVEGIGPGKIRNLLAKFTTTKNILATDYQTLSNVINSKLAYGIIKAVQERSEVEKIVEEELKKLEKLGGKIITVWDKEYPTLLKKIYDPPLLFFLLGELSERNQYSIAIVGTRQPTNYGKVHAEKISMELSKQGITIISGMARGIDSIAQNAAIKSGGRTIAIVGSGLDVIYPAENKKLFEKIAANGAIISEFTLGTKPDAQNFPRRNRIISGLSLGVIVIETASTGGAMQTAAFALDQNREVFALPGNVGARLSEGTNLLIKKSEAELITSADDVINELELKLKPILGKNIPKQQVDLSLFEEKLINVLNSEPLQIDRIATLANMTTSECLVNLLSLEFKGLVKQLPGKMFALL